MSSRHGNGAGAPAEAAAVFAVDWATTRIDGEWKMPRSELRPGVQWSWHGLPWRLDAADGPVRLEGAIGGAALHRVAAARAARFARRTPHLSLGRMPAFGELPLWEAGLLHPGFVVTDGRQAWPVGLARGGLSAGALAVFHGGLPPKDVPLWVVSVNAGQASPSSRRPTRSVLRHAGRTPPLPAAFAPGTYVESPQGPAPVERLAPGDVVLTDAGPKRLLRVRLIPSVSACILPAGVFGDAGPNEPVSVGASTWLGVEGPALTALFGLPEALVRVRDLDTIPGVRSRSSCDVIGLELWPETGGTGLIMAGGLPCLAVPPRFADLRALRPGEAQIAFAHRPAGIAPRMALRGAA